MKRLIATIAALSAMTLLGSSASPADSLPVSPRWSVARGFGRLPLAFEPNVGQANSAVQFLAHENGSTLLLTQTGATFSLTSPRETSSALDPSAPPAGTDILGMRFLAANRHAPAIPTDRLPGVSNYFIGNDPSAWQTNVPRYGRITYRNLYPGIDLTFYGNHEGGFEYDLTLAPGANPSLIELAFDGADALTLDSSGDLHLRLASQTILQPRPHVYQYIGGVRRPVAGAYMLDGDRVRLAVAEFDPTMPLVIDPQIVYSTYLGGTGDENHLEDNTVVDALGDVYTCGITSSTDFPVTPGVVQPVMAGTADAFVAKLNPEGSALIWATYLGGSGFDGSWACTLDPSGHVYLTGRTQSDDFPTTAGALQTSFQGGDGSFCGEPCDAYVAKLSSNGSRLLYSTYLGASGDEESTGIQVDSRGQTYVAGTTLSTDFPTTPGAFQRDYVGGVDIFVAKLNRAGSALVYATYVGGTSDECCDVGLAIDRRGDAFVADETYSADFPITPGALQTEFRGGDDAFVTKLNPQGSALVYSTYLGGSCGETLGNSKIAVDAAGNAYVRGITCSTDFPVTPGAFQTEFQGGDGSLFGIPVDGMVAKIDPSGSRLIFSTYLGASGDDWSTGIAVDPTGHVYVGGITTSDDFPVTPDAPQPERAGDIDGTITELTRDGSGVIFSTYWGGSQLDFLGFGLALDRRGNLYIPGSTGSADFPTTPGAFQTGFNGGDGTLYLGPTDDFMVKIAFGTRDGAEPTRRGSGQSHPTGAVGSRPGGARFPSRWFFRIEG